MTIKRKGRVADGISAAKINEVYLTSHLPASLLRAKIVNLSQNWWHGFHSAIWRVRCDREALIPAVLSHSLTNTSSSLADVISILERDSVHHPSHTIANRLYVFYGASGALPPLKARKTSESESIFENSPYSEVPCQRFQTIEKRVKERNHNYLLPFLHLLPNKLFTFSWEAFPKH